MNAQVKAEYTIHVSGTVFEVVNTLSQALKQRGIDILNKTEVSRIVQKTTGEKMGEYISLDVGNAKDVGCALELHKEGGLIFPSKIAVYTNNNKTWVSFCKPTEALKVLGFTDLEPLATGIETTLQEAVDKMAVKGDD